MAGLGIARALADGFPLVFLTVTEPSAPRPFKESSAALTALVKRLQARGDGSLRWLAVAEWQDRGAVHWHVVVVGLVYTTLIRSKRGRVFPGHTAGTLGHRVRKEAALRPVVERYGFGVVFEIHAVGVRVVDTADETASYLAKYFTKSEDMARLPKGAQPVRSSRGRNQWAPGYTLTSLRDERRGAARERAAAGETA